MSTHFFNILFEISILGGSGQVESILLFGLNLELSFMFCFFFTSFFLESTCFCKIEVTGSSKIGIDLSRSLKKMVLYLFQDVTPSSFLCIRI